MRLDMSMLRSILYEVFEGDHGHGRRATGQFLPCHAEPGLVVDTGFIEFLRLNDLRVSREVFREIVWRCDNNAPTLSHHGCVTNQATPVRPFAESMGECEHGVSNEESKIRGLTCGNLSDKQAGKQVLHGCERHKTSDASERNECWITECG